MIALLDFYSPTLPHGKYFQNDGQGDNEGFVGVGTAFDNYFRQLGDDNSVLTAYNAIGDVIRKAPVDWKDTYITQSLDEYKDYRTSDLISGFFDTNDRHQLLRVPFAFGTILGIGEVFLWDCLEKYWDGLNIFLKDHQITVAFLVTGKSYQSIDRLLIHVKVCVYGRGMADWQDHYVNNLY